MVTNQTPTQAVATIVTQAMENRAISVKSLADDTGIARTTLIRRLSGGSPFTLTELDSIAGCIGTTVVDILTAAQVAA